MTMKKLDMRELARIGAQQTIDAIRAEFPELFPAPKPAPKPAAKKKPHWTQTPKGRARMSLILKATLRRKRLEARKTRKGKAR